MLAAQVKAVSVVAVRKVVSVKDGGMRKLFSCCLCCCVSERLLRLLCGCKVVKDTSKIVK